MGIRTRQTPPDRPNNGGNPSLKLEELPTPWCQRVVPKKSPKQEIADFTIPVLVAAGTFFALLEKPTVCLTHKRFFEPPGGGLETVIKKLENRKKNPSCPVKSQPKK